MQSWPKVTYVIRPNMRQAGTRHHPFPRVTRHFGGIPPCPSSPAASHTTALFFPPLFALLADRYREGALAPAPDDNSTPEPPPHLVHLRLNIVRLDHKKAACLYPHSWSPQHFHLALHTLEFNTVNLRSPRIHNQNTTNRNLQSRLTRKSSISSWHPRCRQGGLET